MIIKKINHNEIINNQNINNKFISVYNNRLKIDCKTLKSDFFLDSFNYFPLTKEGQTFPSLYAWGPDSNYRHFYNSDFSNNFNAKVKDLKIFTNVLILGSSVSNNYYRNMITFLPRIFFINDKKINLVIHRNSSNKFRIFISEMLKLLKIKLNKFVYLDDDFFQFNDSQIPQFIDRATSIKILNKNLSHHKSKKTEKIYLSRQNSNYRNLINEIDIIDQLKSKNFKIIDINNLSIFEQIKLFSSAKVVVSPTSSALTNIVFCKKGTQVIEILPKYKYQYEKSLKNRYSIICEHLQLNYNYIEADPIDNSPNSDTENFINKKVLTESNYYKDLLIKKNKFLELISNF